VTPGSAGRRPEGSPVAHERGGGSAWTAVFLRGLGLGVLVGAAIAGSSLRERWRHGAGPASGGPPESPDRPRPGSAPER
jgi:hypothetical protein